MAFDISGLVTNNPGTDVAVRFMSEKDEFIASEVFPFVFTDKADYKFYQYDKENMKRVDTRKDSKSEADKIAFGAFNRTGRAILHKLAVEIDPDDEADADDGVNDLSEVGRLTVAEMLLRDYEAEAVTKATTTTNYPSDLTVSLTTSSTTWLDAGGSPIGDVATAVSAIRARTGKIAKFGATSYPVMQALRRSPELIARIQYTGALLPDNLIASLLNLEKIFVSTAASNSANEGAADVVADVWGDDFLVFLKGKPQGKEIAYGATFVNKDVYSYGYEDEKRGSNKRIQVTEMGWKYKLEFGAVVSSSDGDAVGGYLIDNAV